MNPSTDPLCPICKAFEESIIHALRDCPANVDVWKMLVNPKHWPKFFSGNIIDWLNFNSSREIGKANYTGWKLTFGEGVRRNWLH